MLCSLAAASCMRFLMPCTLTDQHSAAPQVIVTGSESTENYGIQVRETPGCNALLQGPLSACAIPCKSGSWEQDYLSPLSFSCQADTFLAQIFTPPYLTGNPNRPTITGISNTSPAYGATFAVTFGYTQTSSAPAINRVVLARIGGSTHSVHFDQRQVLPLACTA